MTRQHILAAQAAFHAAAAKGSAAGEAEGTFSRRFPSLVRSDRQPVSLVIAFVHFSGSTAQPGAGCGDRRGPLP